MHNWHLFCVLQLCCVISNQDTENELLHKKTLTIKTMKKNSNIIIGKKCLLEYLVDF